MGFEEYMALISCRPTPRWSKKYISPQNEVLASISQDICIDQLDPFHSPGILFHTARHIR
jgi:hypothetical protein